MASPAVKTGQARRRRRINSNTYSIITGVQSPGTDDQILDQIADVCRRYGTHGPPTAQRKAAALYELDHIAGGRADLLARYASQSLARHDTEPGNAAHERAAQMCITAGADMDLIDRWQRATPRGVNPAGKETEVEDCGRNWVTLRMGS